MSQRTLIAIKYTRGELDILNQRLIPMKFEYDRCTTVENAHEAIVTMRVRGAPAIAVVAALAVAVDAIHTIPKDSSPPQVADEIKKKLDYLATSRPTAVNLHTAVKELKAQVDKFVSEGKKNILESYTELAEEMLRKDTEDNECIMKAGAERILVSVPKGQKVSVLTHCNTGALATTKYGTALGVVRALHYMGRLERLYCTETRPWNQGARLTYFEAGYEGIPATLVADSATAALCSQKQIDAIVVGADRVCANGDTANKIGTYMLALVAAAHNIPFYVAAPWTSIDMSLAHGGLIEIEMRQGTELTHNMQTGQRCVAEGNSLSTWNPSFDVTPARLITGGIITEKGVIRCNDLRRAKL